MVSVSLGMSSEGDRTTRHVTGESPSLYGVIGGVDAEVYVFPVTFVGVLYDEAS